MKKLDLLFAECVLCGGVLVRWQEKRINGTMREGEVMGVDFGTGSNPASLAPQTRYYASDLYAAVFLGLPKNNT